MRAAANPPVPAGVRTTTMTRLLAIARNAFVEVIRQPIFGLIIVLTMAALVLDVPLSSWTMGGETAEYKKTDQQLLINLGLSTLLMSGLFVSAFGAAGVVSREIRDRTILTVVAKPLPRGTVVIGKYLGVAGAVTAAYWLCSLVFLMTVRHGVMSKATDPFDWPVIVLGCSAFVLAVLGALLGNYFFGWHYTSAAVAFKAVTMTLAMTLIAFIGKGWKLVPFGQGIPPDLLTGMLMILLCGLVYAAVAVAASTRLGQLMTLLVCVAFAVVGMWSYYLFGQFGEVNLLGRLAYRLWPNLTFFYTMDAVVRAKRIPLWYAGLTAAYAACQIMAILAIGVVLFQGRETEARGGSSAPRLVTLLAWCGRSVAVGLGVLAVALLGNFDSLQPVAIAVALVLGAAAVWIFYGWFGRGVKWTYFLVFIAAALGLVPYVGALVGGPLKVLAKQYLGTGGLISAIVANALVLLILLLPKTRYHFGFLPKKSR